MNERLKQLMTQASEEFQATMPRNTLSQRATMTIAEEARASGIAIVPDALFEKFAELIVRECVDIAYEYDAPKLSGPGMIIAGRLEEHFGVEE